MKKFFSLLALVVALTGCSQTRFVYSGTPTRTPDYEAWAHYSWWGKGEEFNAEKICGVNNVKAIEVADQASTAWLRVLTVNIYRPQIIRVFCERPVNVKNPKPTHQSTKFYHDWYE